MMVARLAVHVRAVPHVPWPVVRRAMRTCTLFARCELARKHGQATWEFRVQSPPKARCRLPVVAVLGEHHERAQAAARRPGLVDHGGGSQMHHCFPSTQSAACQSCEQAGRGLPSCAHSPPLCVAGWWGATCG